MYFLIVVAVGGTTTITGPLLAALLLGIADVMGKYYVPKLGAFIVYTVMIVILMLRPQGLFGRSIGPMKPAGASAIAAGALAAVGALALVGVRAARRRAAVLVPAARATRCCSTRSRSWRCSPCRWT